MSVFEALISGVVQGVTEFLPISSSGHLVLLHNLFGMNEPDIFFDVCLHFGTLCAVVLYFRGEFLRIIREKDVRMVLYLVVGTVPVVVAGLLFDKYIESFFSDPRRTAVMFMFTAFALFAGQYFLSAGERRRIGTGSSFLIGLGQAIALLPGVSRSGMTISSAIVLGIGREKAFRFSFLLAVPAILGAVCYEILRIGVSNLPAADLPGYAAGTVAAFAAGLISLPLLKRVIKSGKLYIFGVYCLALGMVLLLWI